MLNIMKADLQRIFRGKGIYLTGLTFIILMSLHVFGQSSVGNESLRYSGINMPFYTLQITENIAIALFFILFFVIADDFMHGTIKNAVMSNYSRTRFYLSKILTAYVLCVLLFIIHILSGTIFATLRHGFGGTIDVNWLMEFIKPFSIQLLILLALTCMGVASVFIPKSAWGATVWFVGYVIAPATVIPLLGEIHEGFLRFYDFNLMTYLWDIGQFAQRSSYDLVRIISVSIAHIFITTMIGLLFFRKAEIK